jgi:hypothetical protein
MILSRFWDNFVSMEGKKKEGGIILILRSASASSSRLKNQAMDHIRQNEIPQRAL